MSKATGDQEDAIRRRAYFIWEHEGRPEGRALDHWFYASAEARVPQDDHMEDEEKILAGRPDANMPALLTKDVHGG
jgi:Protein of unknown function (DUF2934)